MNKHQLDGNTNDEYFYSYIETNNPLAVWEEAKNIRKIADSNKKYICVFCQTNTTLLRIVFKIER